MPLFDVSVTRVCCYDHVYRVEADSIEEAEKKGLAEANDDDAHNWCKTWGDVQVDGVHPVDKKGD